MQLETRDTRRRRFFPMKNKKSLTPQLLCASAMISCLPIANGATAQTTSINPAPNHTKTHHLHKSTAHTKSATHVAPQAASVHTAPVATAPVAASAGIADSGGTESITVRAMRRMMREKDSPSAATEIGAAQIRQEGSSGNIVSILRNAPSVYVYQQGIGMNSPVMSVRGTRGLESANTLDGMPMQDLLYGGSGSYLNSILGAPFTMDQIEGVTLYPGVAYPDMSTFGTIGGTVAYKTKRPKDKFAIEVLGEVGSFGTWKEGFQIDSGRLDGALGQGVDAPKMMLQYYNEQTKGFIDYTPARYNSMMFAFDKPYNSAQSLFQATITYNTGSGLILPQPVPSAYQQKYGNFSNYNPSQQYFYQSNDYFNLMLKNDTFINDYIQVGESAFYRYSNSYSDDYANPTLFEPNGAAGSAAVNGINPFNQTVAGFGEQSYYGYGSGVYYQPGVMNYDGNAMYANSASCPKSLQASWAAAGQTNPCGYNSQESYSHTDTYGFQPRISILPPEVFGIRNTIHIGGIIARETQPTGLPTYYGIDPVIPHDDANRVGGWPGQFQRTIFSVYAQDKIDLLDNTLHITPGVTWQGTESSVHESEVYGGTVSAATAATAYCQTYGCGYGPFKEKKWDRNTLPFLNVSYDFDKLVPALRGLSVYGSMGQSALYAPVSDFSPNLLGTAPNASIVHMYEGGIKYNTSHWYISADYFYQKIDRDFGYFSYQTGPYAGYSLYTNDGQRLTRGQEFQINWRPNKTWSFFGNFTHQSARYLKTYFADVTVQEDQFGIAQRGTHVSGIPSWMAQFGVDYNKANLLLKDDDLNVNLTGRYTGHQYTTYDLTGFQNVGPIAGATGGYGTYDYYNTTAGSTTTDPNGGIAPYVIFNLDVNYDMPVHNMGPLKKLNFDFNVQNLFNTFYWQYKYKQISPASCGTFKSNPAGFTGFTGNAVSNYGCTTQYSDGLPGMPATIMFTARATF